MKTESMVNLNKNSLNFYGTLLISSFCCSKGPCCFSVLLALLSRHFFFMICNKSEFSYAKTTSVKQAQKGDISITLQLNLAIKYFKEISYTQIQIGQVITDSPKKYQSVLGKLFMSLNIKWEILACGNVTMSSCLGLSEMPLIYLLKLYLFFSPKMRLENKL